MKRRWTAALLALLLLVLCGCAAGERKAEETPAEATAETPEETTAPETKEAAPVPAATAGPAPAETAAPTLSAEAAPETAESAEPASTETPEPAEEEEITLSARWQLAYQKLLEDPALLDSVIGQNGDYRKGYFGGWDNSDDLLPFSS